MDVRVKPAHDHGEAYVSDQPGYALALMVQRDAKIAVEDLTERQAKHERLEAEIRKHDELYYQKDAPNKVTE